MNSWLQKQSKRTTSVLQGANAVSILRNLTDISLLIVEPKRKARESTPPRNLQSTSGPMLQRMQRRPSSSSLTSSVAAVPKPLLIMSLADPASNSSSPKRTARSPSYLVAYAALVPVATRARNRNHLVSRRLTLSHVVVNSVMSKLRSSPWTRLVASLEPCGSIRPTTWQLCSWRKGWLKSTVTVLIRASTLISFTLQSVALNRSARM